MTPEEVEKLRGALDLLRNQPYGHDRGCACPGCPPRRTFIVAELGGFGALTGRATLNTATPARNVGDSACD